MHLLGSKLFHRHQYGDDSIKASMSLGFFTLIVQEAGELA